MAQMTKKRKLMEKKKNGKSKKSKIKNSDFVKPKKIDKKLKKMLMKKARDYNSDSDEDNSKNNCNEDAEDKFEETGNEYDHGFRREGGEDEMGESDGEGGGNDDEEKVSEDEEGEMQPGVMKFVDGCKAFRLAFRKIIKKTASDDVLGPVLSAHKKLVAEKLAEEEVERKSKAEAKKEKHLVGEKGHVKPSSYLDAHEKQLISVATKGVVKLFNAVNKAQHTQKGLNPLRARDEKVIKKRRKEVFFSELGKDSSQPAGSTSKVGSAMDWDRPAWAPLRDDFMLTNSKLKDWDKKQETTIENGSSMLSESNASSDED